MGKRSPNPYLEDEYRIVPLIDEENPSDNTNEDKSEVMADMNSLMMGLRLGRKRSSNSLNGVLRMGKRSGLDGVLRVGKRASSDLEGVLRWARGPEAIWATLSGWARSLTTSVQQSAEDLISMRCFEWAREQGQIWTAL